MKGWMVGLGAAVVGALAIGVLVLLLATSSDETLVLDLDVRDCFDLTLDKDATEIGTVDVVPCGDPHDAEVVAVGVLDPDGDTPRPPDDALFAQIDARCAAALDDLPDLLERFGILPVAADEASWEPYGGRYVCVAIPYGGGTTIGSALA